MPKAGSYRGSQHTEKENAHQTVFLQQLVLESPFEGASGKIEMIRHPWFSSKLSK
jgi:hypothetical protein